MILVFFLSLSFSQKRFDFDCYQKYKQCIKENKEANIPCYFDFCNYEQCICKETKVTNPMTHYEDTDPGAWGTAIVVCSPWTQIISECVTNYYKENKNKDSKISSKVRNLTLRAINRLKNFKTRLRRVKRRGGNINNLDKKIDNQIKSLKKAIENR